jgi:hypothetical protein
MAGCDASTERAGNTHGPSFGSEGALRGLGSNSAVADLPLGLVVWNRRQNPRRYPLHGRERCACLAAPEPRAPYLWPRESSSNPELSQDRIRALRGPRPSSRLLLFSTTTCTSRDLSIEPMAMHVRCVMLCAWRCMRAINLQLGRSEPSPSGGRGGSRRMWCRTLGLARRCCCLTFDTYFP